MAYVYSYGLHSYGLNSYGPIYVVMWRGLRRAAPHLRGLDRALRTGRVRSGFARGSHARARGGSGACPHMSHASASPTASRSDRLGQGFPRVRGDREANVPRARRNACPKNTRLSARRNTCPNSAHSARDMRARRGREQEAEEGRAGRAEAGTEGRAGGGGAGTGASETRGEGEGRAGGTGRDSGGERTGDGSHNYIGHNCIGLHRP